MAQVVATNQTIPVVGGGITGMSDARISQLHKYSRKLCIPTCDLEIHLRRFKANHNIQVVTMAGVTQVAGGLLH